MSWPFGKKEGRAVSIQRNFYAMATVDGDSAEIVMYGDIVQEQPRDWWTGEPIEGSYIVLTEFLEDLEQLASVSNLTIRLNSCGGDAYAAIPIHNRLRELGAKKTAIVDGVAYSGGSLIMCAADVVRVNPSSLVMIHKCWCFLWGGYNADELRKMAASNDAIDKAQVAIYKRKTGMEDDALLALMAEELYMTGAEAVEKGLADELIDGEPVKIAASADRRTLFINGQPRRVPFPLTGLPESFPTVTPEASIAAPVMANKDQPATSGGNEGGNPMAKSLEELRKENPGLADQIMAEAQAAASAEISGGAKIAAEEERRRLSEIDEIAHLFDDETVRAAKYGDTHCTAQEMAYNAATKAAKSGGAFMAALKADAEESGAASVQAASSTVEQQAAGSGAPKTIEEARAQLAALEGKKEG